MESFSRMGCKNCENVRKPAKIRVFRNWNPKKNFAKTLRKPCKDFRDISQNSSLFTVPVVGVNAPLHRGKCTPTTGSAKNVENPRKAMLFACFLPYFREEVLLLNVRYFAKIFRTSP